MNSWVISNFFRNVTKTENRERGTGNRQWGRDMGRGK